LLRKSAIVQKGLGWVLSLALHALPIGVAAWFGAGLFQSAPRAAVAASASVPFSVDLPERRPEVEFAEVRPEPVPFRPDEPPLEVEVEREKRPLELVAATEPARVRREPVFERPVRLSAEKVAPPPSETAAPEPASEVQADSAPVELHNPAPRYPSTALRRRVEGEALIEVLVLPDGSCGEAKLVECSGSSLFGEAALEAIRQWRYRPAVQDGRAVAASHRVRFVFKLKV
jgi:protein TonB